MLANRAGGDYMKIGLDINHYRSKREANLTALAKRIGAKVARTGRGGARLEPMNPYERRITIHSAISEMEGVKSESIGGGAQTAVLFSSSTNPSARPRRDDRGGKGGKGGRPAGRGGRDSRRARPAPAPQRRGIRGPHQHSGP